MGSDKATWRRAEDSLPGVRPMPRRELDLVADEFLAVSEPVRVRLEDGEEVVARLLERSELVVFGAPLGREWVAWPPTGRVLLFDQVKEWSVSGGLDDEDHEGAAAGDGDGGVRGLRRRQDDGC